MKCLPWVCACAIRRGAPAGARLRGSWGRAGPVRRDLLLPLPRKLSRGCGVEGRPSCCGGRAPTLPARHSTAHGHENAEGCDAKLRYQ